jgi:hypothetical protein
MEEVSCCNCGGYFIPDPRQKDPKYCRKPACQRARKAVWQREKMRCDPDYQANQRRCQQDWCKDNPGYWKKYREDHPKQAERNRVLQRLRNRKRSVLAGVGHGCPSAGRVVKMDTSMIAKMDALKSAGTSGNASFSGQFWLVPVIAKMDALKVNIYKVTACCE